MTVTVCAELPSKSSLETLDDGTILLGFFIDYNDSSSNSIVRKDYLISFSVYWETDGGRSMIVVQNLGGSSNHPVFLDFFQTFERVLNTELNDVVDLTV